MTALGGFLLYARFPVGSAGTELLEEALTALPPGDSALRSHLLAHLALEMWSGCEPLERRVAISEKRSRWHVASVTQKRCSPACTPGMVLTGPGRARERLAHTEEMLRVAKESLKPETEFLAHDARLHCYLELCDRGRARRPRRRR